MSRNRLPWRLFVQHRLEFFVVPHHSELCRFCLRTRKGAFSQAKSRPFPCMTKKDSENVCFSFYSAKVKQQFFFNCIYSHIVGKKQDITFLIGE